MEPTEANKDIEMKPTEPLKPLQNQPTVPPAFSPPAVPSVPSVPTEQLQTKQANDAPGQSAATAVTPTPEPVQKPHVPRPLPQPRHIQIAKQDAAAQSNGTLNTAKPPNEEKAEPRQERQEMREETPEEEVDYDDDNDDNDDNDDDDDDDDDAEKLEEEAKDEKDEKDEPVEVSEGETKGGTSRQAQTEVEMEAASTMPEETQQVQVSEKHKKSRRRHHKNNDGHEKERRRRRRKHKDHKADPDQNGPETGPASKDSPRPDPTVANGAERGSRKGSRRRRRHATDAQNQGHGYHTEPGAGIEPPSKGRRRRSSGASPGADVPANDELPRATPWNSDREGRRRAPPGATAKALPRPFQRDVRDRDSSRGVCDLMGAAQDAIKTVEWNRLVLAQEQAMERDKSDGPRQKLRRPASASPLKRKIPLSRRTEGRDVRLVSREPARRHRSRSRHHSRGRRR